MQTNPAVTEIKIELQCRIVVLALSYGTSVAGSPSGASGNVLELSTGVFGASVWSYGLTCRGAGECRQLYSPVPKLGRFFCLVVLVTRARILLLIVVQTTTIYLHRCETMLFPIAVE